MVAVVADRPRTAPAGARFAYGGTGYVLIGRHVERVTGRTLAAEVQRRIIGPLGLTGTSTPDRETTLPAPHPRHYSTLYTPGGPEHDLTEQDGSSLWASGNMISRLDDLLTVLGALLGGDLLPADRQRDLLTTVPTDTMEWIPNTAYGLGVHAHRLPSGVTVWGHYGTVPGSWTVLAGTRDGRHLFAAHLNTDAVELDSVDELLDAEFGSPTA